MFPFICPWTKETLNAVLPTTYTLATGHIKTVAQMVHSEYLPWEGSLLCGHANINESFVFCQQQSLLTY